MLPIASNVKRAVLHFLEGCHVEWQTELSAIVYPVLQLGCNGVQHELWVLFLPI